MKKTMTAGTLVMSTFLGFQALAYSEAYCHQISDRALRNKTKVMVIGVEGLSQMNAKALSDLRAYSEAAKEGQKFSLSREPYRPDGIIGQAGITRGLMIPLMQSYGAKVEPLVVQENSIRRGSSSIAQRCAEIWMSVPGRKLVIAGHSYGAPAALDLAKNLGQKNINVDALYSVDAVERLFQAPMSNAPNVGYLANYRQQGINSGKPLAFADRDQQLSSYDNFNLGHMSIPGHRAILNDAQSRIASLIRGKEPQLQMASGSQKPKKKKEQLAGLR